VNLFLIRHAKTEKQSISGKDFDRKLAEKGKNQARILNDFIASFDFQAVDIWCSDAERTKQTIAAIDSNFPSENIEFKKELYLASLNEINQLIWNSESDQDLLIIGHNEGLSELASYYAGENIHLKTATFLQITFNADTRKEWSQDLGSIKTLFRPEIE